MQKAKATEQQSSQTSSLTSSVHWKSKREQYEGKFKLMVHGVGKEKMVQNEYTEEPHAVAMIFNC